MKIRIIPAAKESTFWYADHIGEEFEVIDTHLDAENNPIAYRVNTSAIPDRPHAFVLSGHCDHPAAASNRTLFTSPLRASVSVVEG